MLIGLFFLQLKQMSLSHFEHLQKEIGEKDKLAALKERHVTTLGRRLEAQKRDFLLERKRLAQDMPHLSTKLDVIQGAAKSSEPECRQM